VSTFGYTADIYTIIHFISHACQQITVDQSHSSGDTLAKVSMLRICEICKKILVRLSVLQCNKIWYPLRSLFTANYLNVSGAYE
jgi:hypothetical protein